MSAVTIASRYAKSLLDLSIEQNVTEEAYNDMSNINEALTNRDLLMLLKSPIIKPGKKQSVINAVFGSSLGQLTQGFIRLIINKGREKYLPEIVQSFVEQYKTYNKVSTAVIKTAKPLGEESLNKIKESLKNSSVTFDNVELTTEVDESLIGGYVIQIGDRQYDASIAYKLNELRKQFQKNN